MKFLYLLESIRFPALDWLMQGITEFGSEVLFLVAALLLFWCLDKRKGYYLLAVGFFCIVINQFLKLLCRIPRPWVRDPEFTIVESARAGATGYSFPSGHSQTAVGTYGVLAVTEKRRWLRGVWIALMILVPLSRMYLGVHTPADVLVAAGTALALVFLLRPVVYSEKKWAFPALLGGMAVCAVSFVLYVELARFPADMDGENLAHGVKNAYSLLGALLGMILAYILDEKYTRFPVKAVWWAQILKLFLGLGATMAVRMVLKAPLLSLTNGHPSADGIRYFLMVVFAGGLWPMTFRWFGQLGGKQE